MNTVAPSTFCCVSERTGPVYVLQEDHCGRTAPERRQAGGVTVGRFPGNTRSSAVCITHWRGGGPGPGPSGPLGVSLARFSRTGSQVCRAPSSPQPCCCSAKPRPSGAYDGETAHISDVTARSERAVMTQVTGDNTSFTTSHSGSTAPRR